MAQSSDPSEQGVNCASLISPVPDGTHGQRFACHVEGGSNEPAATANSGNSASADALDADASKGGRAAGWKGGAPALPVHERRTHSLDSVQ